MAEGSCRTGPQSDAADDGLRRAAAAHDAASLSVAASGRTSRRSLAWAIFLLVSTGAAWGATFSLARIATLAGAHPLGLTLWQGLLGGLMLVALAASRRRLPQLKRRYLAFYLVCGLLGTVVPSALYFYAAAHVPAGVLSITVALVPILTFAGALLFRIDRAAFGRVLGLLCGLAAVCLIVLPETSLPAPAMVPWVLLAMLAALCYATEGIYVALRRPAGSDPAAAVGMMLLIAAAVLAPIVLVTGTFVPLGLPWGAPQWSVLGIAAINAVSYAVFYYLIQIAGPVFATQMAYVVTLAGVAWGMAIFGEQHSLWIWGALGLMLAGLALVTPRSVEDTDTAGAP